VAVKRLDDLLSNEGRGPVAVTAAVYPGATMQSLLLRSQRQQLPSRMWPTDGLEDPIRALEGLIGVTCTFAMVCGLAEGRLSTRSLMTFLHQAERCETEG
jgi:hypothetical protein